MEFGTILVTSFATTFLFIALVYFYMLKAGAEA